MDKYSDPKLRDLFFSVHGHMPSIVAVDCQRCKDMGRVANPESVTYA